MMSEIRKSHEYSYNIINLNAKTWQINLEMITMNDWISYAYCLTCE